MRNGLKDLRQGICALALASAVAGASLALPGGARADYLGAPRTFLFNPALNVCVADTSKFKKDPPYVVGFSNAGLGDPWRVVLLQNIEQAVSENRGKIKRLIITDAGGDDNKQVADVQDLMSQNIDVLILSANTQQALDPVAGAAMQRGIPVITVDRNVKSPENFVSFVSASNVVAGRLYAQWIVEKLNGHGNVIMVGGLAGTSVNDERMVGAKQVFSQYPGIKILDTQYSQISVVKAKQVTAAMITKYGKKIDAVWAFHGSIVQGIIEAFVDAGYKPGEFPPMTGGDFNGPDQLAVKYRIPLLNVGYPPSMGHNAVEVALATLSGAAVPCSYEINAQIVTTKGDETPSIKADHYVEDEVDLNGPPDKITSAALGKDYDPRTFHVDYPK